MNSCVIIPTYNEEGNIEKLVEKLLNLKQELNIIIVDGNSTDNTGQAADLMAEKYEKVEIIHQSAKLGLGAGYRDGFQRALEQGYDYILTMDSDFSHDPSYVPDLLDQAEKNSIVIGSRYVRGGGTRNWGILRKILSRGANTLARLLLGFKTNDNTAGFRCYHCNVLKTVNYNTIKSQGYSYLIEMLYRCKEKGFKTKEIPIIFVDRCRGDTKISKGEIFKAIKTLLRLFFVRIKLRSK